MNKQELAALQIHQHFQEWLAGSAPCGGIKLIRVDLYIYTLPFYHFFLLFLREAVGRRNYSLTSIDEAVFFYEILQEMIRY